MAEIQQRLQGLSEEYQKLQQGLMLSNRFLNSFRVKLIRAAELQATVAARQKLESQQQENKGVQTEFARLAEEAKIYKLVGPVLLKQEKTEAVLAVDGRLEYIEGDIKRVEKQIADIEEKSNKTRMEIMQIQTQMDAQQQGGQSAQAAA
ncbi:MAG: hypothetical protein M1818_000633 [Claussenomyces sp. TS43310]|nr:MAG: hypothetical protein M1818_000633 [Claussenomyces sp. TS43310]